MTPAEEKRFWAVFKRVLANDDGQRELLSIDEVGNIAVIHPL